MDKTMGYDPIDESSILSTLTKQEKKIENENNN